MCLFVAVLGGVVQVLVLQNHFVFFWQSAIVGSMLRVVSTLSSLVNNNISKKKIRFVFLTLYYINTTVGYGCVGL